MRRFREKGEPIKLFGETQDEARQRLRLVEMMAKEENKGCVKISYLVGPFLMMLIVFLISNWRIPIKSLKYLIFY